jgi:hypothetical protein
LTCRRSESHQTRELLHELGASCDELSKRFLEIGFKVLRCGSK